jgi:hypothetical protein
MDAVRADYKIEHTRCRPIKGYFNTIGSFFEGGNRVAKQILAGLRRALEKDARQVTPKNLDLAAAKRGRYGADLV